VFAAATAFCHVVKVAMDAPLHIVSAVFVTKVELQQLYGRNGLKAQIPGVGVKSLKLAFILPEICAVHLPSLAAPFRGQMPFGV
jgi:hypothetical protein